MRRGRDACISRRLIRLHFAPAYSPAFRAGLFARISRRLIRPHFPPAYCFGILLPDFVPAFRAGILLPDFTPVVSAGGFRFGDSRPEACSIGAVKENRLRERSEGGFRFREGQPAEKC